MPDGQTGVSYMRVALDFKWEKAVRLDPEMVERLCLDLASRAENFLVVEGLHTGLDDVTVDAGRTAYAVERAADAIRVELDSGYRQHWCTEWIDKDGHCECCLRIARAALEAALREGDDA